MARLSRQAFGIRLKGEIIGGRGAATGALIGGTVRAVTGAFRPRPGYAYPYRGYVAHRGCRWIPAHRNSWGEWPLGDCARW